MNNPLLLTGNIFGVGGKQQSLYEDQRKGGCRLLVRKYPRTPEVADYY
jgi:hypothetical protein